MKVPPIFWFAIFFIVGCLALSGLAYGAFGNGAKSDGNSNPATAEILPTRTLVQPTNTPTPNRLIERKQEAEAEAAELNVIILSDGTTSTAQVGIAILTEQAQDKIIGATTTAQVYSTQIAPTLEANRLALQAIEKQRESRAQIEYCKGIVLEIIWPFTLNIGTFIFTIFCIYKFFKFIKAMGSDPEQPPANSRIAGESTGTETTIIQPIETPAIRNGNSTLFFPKWVTDGDLQFIANGITRDGRGLAYARWTPKSNGFSRDEWGEIIQVLLAGGVAVFQNGVNDENGYRLLAEGWRYFKEIADKAPHPADENSQNDSENDT